MRRLSALLFIFIVTSLACHALVTPSSPVFSPSPEQPTALHVNPIALPTGIPSPTTKSVFPTSLPSSPAPSPQGSIDLPYSVRYHPDGLLYAGDQVSFEVIARSEGMPDQSEVLVYLAPGREITLGHANFDFYGIEKRLQATIIWTWDTSDLDPGNYNLVFSVQPSGLTWTETVTLLPQDDLPAGEADATWALAKNECCVVYYVTGTAAERDLPVLLEQIDEQADLAANKLDIQLSVPVTITLIPRLLGHGGFAGREVNVSYLDRNYAGSRPDQVILHEIVHILDNRLGGELRPSLFAEGLAVYLSGGHYKPEPLLSRAAALLEEPAGAPVVGLGWYLPLASLADDFYLAQHEIGYLQAGAMVEFMVEEWGWERFSQFYRDIRPHPSRSQAQAIQRALSDHYDLTLAGLEAEFITALHRQPTTADLVEDVRLTVLFYDTARRYQQALDPSAFFLSAWLLDVNAMRQRGVVADYLRRPDTSANLALETMLLEANLHLVAGRFAKAAELLEGTNTVLGAIEMGEPHPFALHHLAADYLAVVNTLQTSPGLVSPYQPQRISLQGNRAQVWVSADGPELVELEMIRLGDRWVAERRQGSHGQAGIMKPNKVHHRFK